MSNYIIGIDTSNYKTSISVVSENGEVVFAKSEFIDVKNGERGLRQQTAFFMHNNRLPEFIRESFENIDGKVIAVAVSDAPRRLDSSYMPVFIAGLNAAKILSTVLNVPLYRFSHQEGHIEAVVHKDAYNGYSAGIMHLSGGTTELLRFTLNRDVNDEFHYDVEIIGGTKDISIGQLLDRIGVKTGYDFPAGKYLDELAEANREVLYDLNLKTEKPFDIKTDKGFFNLSGIETEMMRMPDLDKVPLLMYRIARLIYNEATFAYDNYGIKKMYLCGGVSASIFLRNEIFHMLEEMRPNFEIVFGEKSLSGDNAVGISLLAGRNL